MATTSAASRPYQVLRRRCTQGARRAACCLVERDQAAARDCQVKEASWPLFAKIRQGALREGAAFEGCERHVLRGLYSWEPSELVELCCAFSRAGSPSAPALLRAALFRADRLVAALDALALVRLLEVCALHGIREHDPKRPDIFVVAAPCLAECAFDLGSAEVGRLCTLYRQLNIGDPPLLEALGARLLQLFGRLRRPAPSQPLLAAAPAALPGPSAPSASSSASSSSSSSAPAPRPPREGRPRPRTAAPPPAAVGKRGGRGPHEEVTPLIIATMSYLVACGRLNTFTEHVAALFEIVAPLVRARRDVGHLTALAQLSAKFGLSQHSEAERVLVAVCIWLEEQPAGTGDRGTKGYTSQVVYGQLLLALVFNESSCETRDRALVMAVGAVHATFGGTLRALDERLARQLQVADLACRLERPQAWQTLEEKGFKPFLERVQEMDHEVAPLTKCSSQQHWQVSGALSELGVRHRLEEHLLPYVADVRVMRTERRLIEIDGPLHFVGRTARYDMKSMLKHRLLTKQGWHVHHIAWYDWPEHHHSRLTYLARLLRSPAPPATDLSEYRPLSDLPAIEPPTSAGVVASDVATTAAPAAAAAVPTT